MATKKFQSQFAEIPMADLESGIKNSSRYRSHGVELAGEPPAGMWWVQFHCGWGREHFVPFVADMQGKDLRSIHPRYAVDGGSEDEHEEEEEWH